MSTKSFKVVQKVFQGSFKNISRKFQENFKGVSRKFKGCFKEDWRMFQWSFKWASNLFKKVQLLFQESFKGVSRTFQGSFKVDTRKNEGCSQRPRKFQQYLKKASSAFKKISIKIFKGVSRMFQWSFVLQFCSRMYLIAATRAKGGLVWIQKTMLRWFYLEDEPF